MYTNFTKSVHIVARPSHGCCLLFTKPSWYFQDQTDGDPFQTTCQDLAGFWDMVLLQIDDLETKFAEIETLKNNGWISRNAVRKRPLVDLWPNIFFFFAQNRRAVPVWITLRRAKRRLFRVSWYLHLIGWNASRNTFQIDGETLFADRRERREEFP